MKLGILETGKMADHLADEHGHYPELFQALLGGIQDLTLHAYEVVHGHFPDDAAECDAWLVTGSKYGVYDDEPWIAPLKTFLIAARERGVPMIGICFGHQIMAEAFGGRAEKSDRGWGCGAHEYEVLERPEWMEDPGDAFSMYAMHQDQVTALPDDAVRLATSPFCENAMVAWGDPATPDAISIQPHPEFTTGLAKALVEFRRDTSIPVDVADTALATLGSNAVQVRFFVQSVANYLALKEKSPRTG